MTKDYYGTKKVTAWEQEKDGKSGYSVKYADGYISWSPKDVFEAAYKASGEMSFGHALVAILQGHRVARAGWNGKGMWISYSPGAERLAAANFWSAANKQFAKDNGGEAQVLPCITFKTADNKILMGWLASQTDMLANDWSIVE